MSNQHDVRPVVTLPPDGPMSLHLDVRGAPEKPVSAAHTVSNYLIYEVRKVGEVVAATRQEAVERHYRADSGQLTLFKMPGNYGDERDYRLSAYCVGDGYSPQTGDGEVVVVCEIPYHLVA